MRVEYLGQIGYKLSTCIQGFLVSINQSIETIKRINKKIVLYGIGENAFYAEKFLSDIGIEIYCYVDNSAGSHRGSKLRGKEIYFPYDLFGREEIYFIIAVGKDDIDRARLQFMTHQIQDYSVFLPNSFWHFAEEEAELREAVLASINMICFEGEKMEDALPYQGIAVGGDGKKLGILNTLLYSTIQSGFAYQWERQIVEKQKTESVMEIGPGYGLMSLVLLKQFENIIVDWMIFGEPEDRSQYKHALEKIKDTYENRINRFYGYIEMNNFAINKKYDLVILTEVFEHFVLNPIDTLKKIKKALNPGGKIVLATPNWGHVHIYQTWRELPKAETVDREQYIRLTKCGHAYQYSKEELTEIFDMAGLRIERYGVTDSNHHNIVLSILDEND